METTPLLISKADLAPFRWVSGNLTPAQVEPFILDAQEFELRPFLGDDLYLDVLASYQEPDYQKLLDGENFVWPVGSTRNRRFIGIKSALAYFVLELLVSEGGIHITATGTYEKDNEFSRAPSTARIQQVTNNFHEKGLKILSDARHYLDAKKSSGIFLNWRITCNSQETPGTEPSLGMAHKLTRSKGNGRRYINGELM